MDMSEANASLTIVAVQPALTTDDEGVVRVGGTRVTLDTVIQAFREGATAEEIAIQYPALQLADVYSAISYYLQREDEVEVYLLLRAQERADVRAQNEARYPSSGIRERLLARRGQPDASSGC
jgi:uncharacterized protein (DUF433 family)